MNDPLRFADWMYQLLLRVYPREYIESFGDEIQQTFREGASEARLQGRLTRFVLRELLDIPRVIWTAYGDRFTKKLDTGLQILQEMTSTDDLPPVPKDGRESWLQVVLEISLFVAAGLFLIGANYFTFIRLDTGWQHHYEWLGKIILPLSVSVFLFGLLLGLPRWAYPFGGLFIGYQVLLAGQNSVWMFLFVMFFLSSVLAFAAILSDPQPSRLPVVFRRIRQSASADWTRLSFTLYGAMPCVILVAFDDSHLNNQTPYLVFSVLAMTICGLMYCRSRVRAVQLMMLFIGLTLSVCGALLDQISFAQNFGNWIRYSSQSTSGNVWLLKLWAEWIMLIMLPTLFMRFGKVVKPGPSI